MKRMGRLYWLLFLAILIGLAYGTHRAFPPAPRWSISGSYNGFLSSDGSRVISWPMKGQEVHGPVQVWDAQSQRLLASYLTDGRRWPYLFCGRQEQRVSGQKENLMVACRPHRWHVIDFGRNTEWTINIVEAMEFNEMYFSPSGDFVRVYHNEPLSGAKASRDVTFAFYDLHTGAEVGRFPKAIYSRFIADSDSMIVGTSDVVGIWNLKQRSFEQRFPVAWHALHSSANGQRQAAQTAANAVTVWDRGRQVHVLGLTPHRTAKKRDMRFSPDGRWLVTYPYDAPVTTESILEIWDTDTGQCVGSHLLGESWPKLNFSLDSRTLAIHAVDKANKLTVLELPSGRERWRREWRGETAPGDIELIHFDPHKTLVVRTKTSLDRLDAATGELLDRRTESNRFLAWTIGSNVIRLVLNPNIARDAADRPSGMQAFLERWMPSLASSSTLIFLDANTGAESLRIRREDGMSPWNGPPQVSQDGKTLLTKSHAPGNAAVIEIWDLPSSPRWSLVVGLPLGLFLLFHFGRQWRKRRLSESSGNS